MKKITQFDFVKNRTKSLNRWLGRLAFCTMTLIGSIGYSNAIQPESTSSYLPLVYCTPFYEDGCYDGDDISNVTLEGESITLNNSTTACSANAFQDYTALAAPDLAPGSTYSISVSTGYFFPDSEDVKIWIDYNGDTEFSASELIATTNGGGLPSIGPGIFNFTVPVGVPAGDYRMRVRLVYSSSDFTACSDEYYGETEDYTINIIQLNNCTGMPDAGTAVITPTGGNPNSLFIATATGISTASELEFQWQKNTGTTWEDITGATNATSQITSEAGAIGTVTEYRLAVTCTVSSQTAYSLPASYTIQLVYCTPTYFSGCTGGDQISNVTLQGESETLNNSSTCSPAAYGDFTGLTAPDLAPGNTYTISVSTDYTSPTSEHVKAWIDYDADGTFSESELIANTNDAGLVGGTTEFTFTVPTNITAGEYRLRVRMVYGFATPVFDACSAGANWGEIEDYTIQIIQLDNCVGTPNAGTVTSPIYACSNENFVLSTLGATAPADGLTGIWQSSPAGMNDWVDVVGATSVNYTMIGGVTSNTDFRYKMTCSNSNETDISDTISVIMNEAVDCYCIPTGTSTTNYITGFTTSGGTENISNTDNGLSAGGYGDFYLFHNLTQEIGDSVDFEVTAFGTATSGLKIWVDWNQNGSFEDDGELAYASNAYANIHTGSFIVSNDALAGQTRMRIGNSNSSNSGPTSPCMTNLAGEYEDYMLTVYIPVCVKPFDLALDAITPNSATISWTSTGSLFDIELGEEGFFQSGIPTTSGVTNPHTINGLDSSTTYEFYVRQDCGADGYSNWAGPFRFTTECLPPNITGTTPGEVCGEGEVTLSATADGGTIAWYADETGGPKLNEGASFTTPELTTTTSYWVSAFLGGGMENVGPENPSIGAGGYSTLNNYVTFFTVTSATSITSVDVFANTTSMGSAGAIKITDMSDNSTVGTYPYIVTQAGSLTEGQTILIDQALSAGNYKMEMVGTTVSLYRNTAGAAFPYTSSTVNLTGQSFDGYPEYYYFFYNWVIGSECSSARTEVIATVTDAPDFELSQTTLEICEGDTSDAVTITTGASDYDTFEWTPSLGVSGDATTGWSFDPTETTTYILTASQSAGVCTTSVEFTITVNAAPVLIGITASATEICEGSSVELIANSATAASYCPVAFPSDVEPITLVEFEEISNATSATVNGTPNLENFTNMAASVIAGNTYSITVNGNTNGSFTNNFYVYIDWNQNGVFTDPGETYSIGSINSNNGSGTPLTYTNILVPSTALNGNTRMRVLKKFSASTDPGSCNTTGYGQAEDYTVNVTGGVNLYDYSWSDGTSEVGTTSPLTVNPTTTTTYTVTVTGANGCTIAESIEITVNQTPDAPVATSPQLIAEGQTIADIIVTGDNLTWYTDEDLTDEVDASTVLTEGIYTFYVTASIGDCTSEATMITVEVSLSTKDFDTASFKAYPNPVKDYFNISYSKDIQNIAVVNMLGQTVFTKTVNATDTQIDMTSLPTGTYFVKVNVDGAVKTIKVAKQ